MHVRAHTADTHMSSQTPFETQANKWCDSAAKAALSLSDPPFRPHPRVAAYMLLDSRPVVAQERSVIYESLTAPAMEQYLAQK